jgi:hypothetical protein
MGYQRDTTGMTSVILVVFGSPIPVLIANKLLKPLGNPPPNGGRYFSSSEVEQLRLDTKWLDRASALLIKHWKVKNDRKTKR